ncbi:MAG: murein biosynthesis integral membrane protein MurJ [Chromatiaceae bacterium]
MASLSASLTQVGGNTLLSRLLGFVRDLVLARLFGADAGTDAFFVAFKIPNLFRRLFAEGAFASVLVPVLHETGREGGPAGLHRLLASLSGVLGAGLLLLTLIGTLAASWLILALAPGFAAEAHQQALAAELLRLTLPYVFFIVLAALAGAALNLHEHFGIPAFTPVLLNLAIIGCAFWLAPRLEEPILALGWGVLIGGLAQLAFQLPFLARLGLLLRPSLDWRHPGTRKVLHRMGPVLLGVSVTQINLLLDTFLASFLTAGSISWLYYSDRLVEFPLGILGAALGTVILPRLARQGPTLSAGGVSPEAFSRTLDWALRWVWLLGLPAAVGLVGLAEPLVATLFLSAEFSAGDAHMAALSLMAYAAGLPAFIAIKVLAPGYYAHQDARTPARHALLALGFNLVLSLAWMGPFGHAGLALATSLAAFVNAGLLLGGLMRPGAYRPARGWGKLLARGLVAALVLGALLSWSLVGLDDWLAATGGERLARLFFWMLLGGAGYFLALLALGVRPRDFGEAAGKQPEQPPAGVH